MSINVSVLEGGEGVCPDYFLDITPTLAFINICASDDNHYPCPVINGNPCPYGVDAKRAEIRYFNGQISAPIVKVG